MRASVVRWVATAVFVGGIAGMIVSSIKDNTDAGLAFGLATAAAAFHLIVLTAVGVYGNPRAPLGEGARELTASGVEDRVQALARAGADESQVRELVREAVRLGRGS